MTPAFWAGRRVLLTGHTGFKGAWCAAILSRVGAVTTGFALPADTSPSLWESIEADSDTESLVGDVRDLPDLTDAVAAARPEIVLHMAALSQVREGYRRPLDAFSINVLGTAHVLQSLRGSKDLKAVLVVTSDKVYRNADSGSAFEESAPLGGDDPYSASKAASEMVAEAFGRSFMESGGVAVATARGGNVIGGGDWASDRLVPDTVRAAAAGQAVELRNPRATRPWQHVLDCVWGYLSFAEWLCGRQVAFESLNFGPIDGEPVSVARLSEEIARRLGSPRSWTRSANEDPPEKQTLHLSSRRSAELIGWRPALSTATAIDWTAEWYGGFLKGHDPWALTSGQIDRYLKLRNTR